MPLQPAVHEAYCNLLGRAFENDPMSRHLFKNDAARFGNVKTTFSFMLSMGIRHGTLHAAQNGEGLIVCLDSYLPCTSLRNQVRCGVLGLLFGVGLRNFLGILSYDRYSQRLHSQHARKDDVYLYIIAVAAEHRRKGVGGELLKRMLAGVTPGRRVYLETSNPDNIPFYEKHGFRILDDLAIPDSSVHIWPMVFPAATAPPETASSSWPAYRVGMVQQANARITLTRPSISEGLP